MYGQLQAERKRLRFVIPKMYHNVSYIPVQRISTISVNVWVCDSADVKNSEVSNVGEARTKDCGFPVFCAQPIQEQSFTAIQ